MARIITQDPLSRGPGQFSSGGGIGVPNMPAVNTSKAGAIASVLNSAAQALGVYAQVKVAKSDQDLATEYESTKAQLIRHQQEAIRDPTRQGVFLSSYGAAAEKFSGTRFEADIASFGEGTVTDFQRQAADRAALATKGFYSTRVLPAVQEALLEPDMQENLLSVVDFTDRQQMVEGLIYSKMPEDMPGFLGPDGEQQMALMVQSSAADLNDRLQGEFERRTTLEQKKQTELAIRGGVVGLASGNSSYEDYRQEMERLQIPATEYERTASTSLSEAVRALAVSGDRQGLHEAVKASRASLEAISDPTARRQLTEAVALGHAAQGMLSMEAIGMVWSETATVRGLEAANQEVDQTARDLLSLEYGAQAYTVDDIKRLPSGGYRGEYLNSVLRAVKSVTEVPVASEMPVKIRTAVSDFLQPSTAADGDPAAMLKFTLEERTQLLGTLAQAASGDPEYTRLLAEAATDPGKYAAVIADRFSGTRHEAGLVNYMLSPNNGYFDSDDGVQIIYDTIEQLGGLDAINTHVEDKALAAALRKAYPNQVSAAAIREYKTAYDQIRVDIGEKAAVGLTQAIQSQAFTQAYFGTGGFFGGDESVGMDPDTAGKIATMIPLDNLPEGEFGAQKLADLIKTNMDNAGMYLIKVPTGAPGTRSRMQIVHSKVIPETIGKPTQLIESGLNNPESDAARYFGSMLGGTSTNIWDHAAQRIIDQGRNDGFDKATIRNRLDNLLENKQAVIRVKSLQAGQTGVPITLQMFEKGKEPAEVLLGYYNFNDGFLSEVGPQFFTNERPGFRGEILDRADRYQENPTFFNFLRQSIGASPFNPF